MILFVRLCLTSPTLRYIFIVTELISYKKVKLILIPGRAETNRLRLSRRRSDPELPGILPGLPHFLRDERGCLQRAVLPYDSHGQRQQERRGDDWQTHLDIQPYPSSRDHQGTD